MFNIGESVVGGRRTFVIAEIGNNHNGDLERAIELIDVAVDAGVDCVKFQMRHMDALYRRQTLLKQGEDLGTEYVLDLLSKFELTLEQHERLRDYSISKGVHYMCTPWDQESADVLEKFGVEAYKIASADLTNIPLIQHLMKKKVPLILSTGMSSEYEIRFTANLLRENKADFVFLHCNSTYPAPLHDINLKWMDTLANIHPIFGYSGHERGTAVSLAAVAMGAKVIERHLTLDRNMEGPDHAASLTSLEFGFLVEGIRQIELAFGDGSSRTISQGEMINRENLAKSLVAASDLKVGHVLRAEDIRIRSPGQGLSPQKLDDLIGKTLVREMVSEDYFYPSDLQEEKPRPRAYQFKRPWGIPVRYHDIDKYMDKVEPDFVEFHLSYSDLDLDLNDYLRPSYDSGFVVHAPELFSESRLMDLASNDSQYLKESVAETQRVIDLTRSLKSYFPKETRPLIVANVGGFTMDAPLSSDEVMQAYNVFAESLQQLDLDGVELIPQTMAPFPWHFGGQRFQNLFVHAGEIVEWCEKLGLRVCFDVSHSMLASNHFGFDFYDFAKTVSPYTAHLHLGDASGVNGEGLQIGEGTIDFDHLARVLQESCPEASFIPEIWQGHKNDGEGFWMALNILDSYF